jgi:RNA polymerase sigma-70 factor (ECF subfamily)
MGNDHFTDSFVQQILMHKGIIHKICNIYCNTLEDKEDMMQEITLQLWKSFPGFQHKSKFSTWMYQIALNTAITSIRKSGKELILEAFSDEPPKIPDKEDIPSLDEDINRLYKAIGKLNDVDKAIILLYLEKKTYAEIGEIVGIKEKNVSVKIVRIKTKLKKLMV